MGESDDPLLVVEAAMVAIGQRQARRTVARDHGAGTLPDHGALFEVLALLEAEGRAGREVALGAVADRLGVDQPRASKLVSDAVRRRLVLRNADQNDGRRTLLTLTSSGAAAVTQVRNTRRQAFAAAMTDWSPDERVQFARLLNRFVEDLHQPAQIPDEHAPEW